MAIYEEGVLRIFIVLKNPSPWPGSNPQPLCPVASTLTSTPPRRLSCTEERETGTEVNYSSRRMDCTTVCEISGSQGGNFEDDSFLEYSAV
jgi:hypothetical protein